MLSQRRWTEKPEDGSTWLPRGGSGDTVGNTSYRLQDFRQTGGSSFRIAVDVGGWDGSLFMNSPGQPGDPGSPPYDDLFPVWATNPFRCSTLGRG